MALSIPCDHCAWEGPADEVGEHLDASPECAKLALEEANSDMETLEAMQAIAPRACKHGYDLVGPNSHRTALGVSRCQYPEQVDAKSRKILDRLDSLYGGR